MLLLMFWVGTFAFWTDLMTRGRQIQFSASLDIEVDHQVAVFPLKKNSMFKAFTLQIDHIFSWHYPALQSASLLYYNVILWNYVSGLWLVPSRFSLQTPHLTIMQLPTKHHYSNANGPIHLLPSTFSLSFSLFPSLTFPSPPLPSSFCFVSSSLFPAFLPQTGQKGINKVCG